MKLEVTYMVPKVVEVELTETLFRELYNKHKDRLFVRSKIENDIYEYLERESGYLQNDGCHLEFDGSVEDWVWDMYEKVNQEE